MRLVARVLCDGVICDERWRHEVVAEDRDVFDTFDWERPWGEWPIASCIASCTTHEAALAAARLMSL